MLFFFLIGFYCCFVSRYARKADSIFPSFQDCGSISGEVLGIRRTRYGDDNLFGQCNWEGGSKTWGLERTSVKDCMVWKHGSAHDLSVIRTTDAVVFSATLYSASLVKSNTTLQQWVYIFKTYIMGTDQLGLWYLEASTESSTSQNIATSLYGTNNEEKCACHVRPTLYRVHCVNQEPN